jgi:predicted DNA binding CopG/RHH family protein
MGWSEPSGVALVENTKHLQRHGVTPKEFEELLAGDPVYLEYQVPDDEERYKVLGVTEARVLIGIWTPRVGKVRAITAYAASRAYRNLLGDAWMKQKRAIPAFKSEAEEAEWWYKNRARLDKDLVTAAKKGKLKRLNPATLKARLAASKSRVVSIRLAEEDIKLAREQATERGLPYQTYIKSVLHQALRQTK